MKQFKQQAQAQLLKSRKGHSSKSKSLKLNPRVERVLRNDPFLNIKSELITSNKMQEMKSNKKANISETWDKIELYAQKKREKLALGKEEGEIKPLKGSLQILQHINGLLSKDAILSKFDDSKLVKMFIVSTLVLVLQLSLSKKTRYVCYNMLNILMYVTGFTLSAGTLAIFILKLRQKLVARKAHKDKKRLNEQPQKNHQL